MHEERNSFELGAPSSEVPSPEMSEEASARSETQAGGGRNGQVLFADMLRQEASNATWWSSIKGAWVCGFPATAFLISLVAGAIMFRLYSPPITPTLLVIAAMFFVALGGSQIDLLMDLPVDRVCAPHRPIPSGQVSPLFVWHAFLLSWVLSITLIAVASEQPVTLTNVPLMAILGQIVGLLLVNLSGKINKVLSGVLLAVVYSTAIWLPALIIEDVICQKLPSCGSFRSTWYRMDVWPLSLVYFLLHLHRDTVLDIADRRGDKAGELKTFATVLGRSTAYCIAVFILVLAIAPLLLVYFAVWHPDWQEFSRGTFVASTAVVLLISGASDLLLAFLVSCGESIKLGTELKETSSFWMKLSWKAAENERSWIRKNLKLQFIIYTIYILVNVLVGYG